MSQVRELTVSWRTLARLAMAWLVIWAFVKLQTLFVYLLFAALFSIAMSPMVAWFEKRGFNRGYALATVLLIMVGAVFGLFGIIIASFTASIIDFVRDAPALLESLRQYEQLESVITAAQDALRDLDIRSLLQSGINQGSSVISGASRAFEAVLFIFFFTVYMLLEREYLLRIFHSLLNKKWSKRMMEMEGEIVSVVGGYMRGQVITSFLVGVSSYIFFRILGVPNAAALAIIAGITDVIPVIGGLLGIVPAALIALTVGPLEAVLVIVLMQSYSTINNYLISPKVYGSSLELSPFIVTLATTAGLYLFGIAGILLALPVAAIAAFVLTKYYNVPVIPDEVDEQEPKKSAKKSTKPQKPAARIRKADKKASA